MNKEAILGLIRHILTFGGGAAVAQGQIADSDLTTGVAAVMTLIGIVWSVLDKKNRP